MVNCIFCKIAAGEIPARKIFEDGSFMAFLDIQPVSVGHLLVIPKAHFDGLSDMTEDILGEMFLLVRRLAIATEKAVGAEGYNVIMNKGTAAGQAIAHAHAHVIPRRAGDGLMPWPKAASLSDREMDDLALLIAKKVA